MTQEQLDKAREGDRLLNKVENIDKYLRKLDGDLVAFNCTFYTTSNTENLTVHMRNYGDDFFITEVVKLFTQYKERLVAVKQDLTKQFAEL